jgi:hypothetical protein
MPKVTVDYEEGGRLLKVSGFEGHPLADRFVEVRVEMPNGAPALGHALCATIMKHLDNFLGPCHQITKSSRNEEIHEIQKRLGEAEKNAGSDRGPTVGLPLGS